MEDTAYSKSGRTPDPDDMDDQYRYDNSQSDTGTVEYEGSQSNASTVEYENSQSNASTVEYENSQSNASTVEYENSKSDTGHYDKKNHAQEYEEFLRLARPILDTPGYSLLKSYIQHGNVTTYEHCLDVAWKAFRLNRMLHLGVNEADLVTACLLHDYYLYDWHTKGDRLHGYHHPAIAAEQAQNDYRVNKEVADAIRTHMWPLTLTKIPNSKIAWLLTMSDKICSANETLFRRNKSH